VWKTENIANYLLKGKQVFLEGRIETRSYDKDGQKHYMTEIICDANNVMLLGGGGGRGEAPDQPGDFDRPVSMPRSAQPRPQPVAAPAEEFHQGIIVTTGRRRRSSAGSIRTTSPWPRAWALGRTAWFETGPTPSRSGSCR
jgi:single-stranded DNA-binding protein